MLNRVPICDSIRTQAILNQYLGKAKKSLGQNFLVDLEAIKGIISSAEIKPDDQVIEIGPGIGSLTEQLLLAGAKVLAYEVDNDLPEILNNELPKKIGDEDLSGKFKLVMKDILKADFDADSSGFFDFSKPIKIVANLPYYITTPIIFYLINSNLEFVSLSLMMQKEVAERLLGKPRTKAYGPLTIAVQSRMQVELSEEVLRTSFIPRPNVDSAVVKLSPLIKPFDIQDFKWFDHVVKLCFSQRRKTLANNLKVFLKQKDERDDLIKELGLDARVRPEELTIEQFINLSDLLMKTRI